MITEAPRSAYRCIIVKPAKLAWMVCQLHHNANVFEVFARPGRCQSRTAADYNNSMNFFELSAKSLHPSDVPDNLSKRDGG